MSRRIVRSLAVGGVLALVAACSSRADEADHGDALVLGSDHSEVCFPSSPGIADFTFGVEVPVNRSDADVLIQRIDVRGGKGVSLPGTYLVSVAKGSKNVGIGFWAEWPPPAWAVKDFPGWPSAKTTDLVIPPDASSNQLYNLVVHVATAVDRPAGFQALRIYYRTNGHQYYQDTTEALLLDLTC